MKDRWDPTDIRKTSAGSPLDYVIRILKVVENTKILEIIAGVEKHTPPHSPPLISGKEGAWARKYGNLFLVSLCIYLFPKISHVYYFS